MASRNGLRGFSGPQFSVKESGEVWGVVDKTTPHASAARLVANNADTRILWVCDA
jgi:hypothetical protein